jgi:two-component system, chemotaxis family, chemotaxis protein CheY
MGAVTHHSKSLNTRASRPHGCGADLRYQTEPNAMPGVILAVDDSASMRQMVRFTLEGAGYKVVQAADGVEALTIAKSNNADLVLTDVNMPRMDGLSLVRELRALDHYKFVPMLVLTTESGNDTKQRGKEAGATGWIVKPFNPEQLLATIARVL